jgi:hypothetical protein
MYAKNRKILLPLAVRLHYKPIAESSLKAIIMAEPGAVNRAVKNSLAILPLRLCFGV